MKAKAFVWKGSSGFESLNSIQYARANFGRRLDTTKRCAEFYDELYDELYGFGDKRFLGVKLKLIKHYLGLVRDCFNKWPAHQFF